MLKKIFKAIALILLVIVIVLAGFYAKIYHSTERRMNKIYAVAPQSLVIESPDSMMLAEGARFITTKGCNDCHSADLGGRVFIDDPALGMLVARNLTKGKGGLPGDYSTTDWLLALKHGIRRDGKPLLFMPSHDYTFLTERDMKAIIAYCQQLAPIDRELPPSSVGPVGRVLTHFDKFSLLPAEMIDHNSLLVKEVKVEATAEYGKYLSITCRGCHHENMKGGDPVAPGYPVVADISSTGNVGKWNTEQFVKTLRTGRTPEGKELKNEYMPWLMTKAYNDIELEALHLYLRSL